MKKALKTRKSKSTEQRISHETIIFIITFLIHSVFSKSYTASAKKYALRPPVLFQNSRIALKKKKQWVIEIMEEDVFAILEKAKLSRNVDSINVPLLKFYYRCF